MRLRGVLLLLSCLIGLGACRTHELEDGPYTFTLGEVLRDECDLASQPGVVSTGLLATTGDIVNLDYAFLDIKLVGTYLVKPVLDSKAEQMTLDGTAVNVRTPVRGQACLLDTVALHMDATTRSATTFDGVMSFTLDTRQPDECVCQFWLRYQAHR